MKIVIWANIQKQEFWDLLPELLSWFHEHKQEVLVTPRIDERLKDKDKYLYSILESHKDFSKVDFVLALGGDGTILSAARAVGQRKTPILGVHLGGFGFLAEGTIGSLYGRLQSVIKNKFQIFPRMVLEVDILNDVKKTFYSLNDLVIDRGESYRLMKCSISMDNRKITSYSADGLIISTPTGSTAYNLAAGGPIIAPWLSLFTVTPICPHSLSSRPIVLPSQQQLTITFPKSESEVRIAIDGQEQEKIAPDTIIRVRRASYDVQMITFEDRDYFHTLRTKMGWGQSERTK